MIEIDEHLAIKTLRECVAERGEDYLYQAPEEDCGTCLYWHRRYIPDPSGWSDGKFQDEDDEGEPGCLIGLMLHKLGVSPEVIREYEGQSVASMEDHPDFRFSPAAREVCRVAQAAQDKEIPWGKALAQAESTYKVLTKGNTSE